LPYEYEFANTQKIKFMLYI